MPRTYKKAAGCRPYANYTEDMLENALKEIRDTRISICAAANKYGIHRNTLMNKLHGKHTAQIGGQTVFSHEEEDMFAAHAVTMCDYGFPLSLLDLRFIVKAYLDRCGRTVFGRKHEKVAQSPQFTVHNGSELQNRPFQQWLPMYLL